MMIVTFYLEGKDLPRNLSSLLPVSGAIWTYPWLYYTLEAKRKSASNTHWEESGTKQGSIGQENPQSLPWAATDCWPHCVAMPPQRFVILIDAVDIMIKYRSTQNHSVKMQICGTIPYVPISLVWGNNIFSFFLASSSLWVNVLRSHSLSIALSHSLVLPCSHCLLPTIPTLVASVVVLSKAGAGNHGLGMLMTAAACASYNL